MKVCLVSKHFPPFAGGVEARVFEMARWLAGRGDSVVVLTSHEAGTKSHEVVDGVEVRRSHTLAGLFNAPLVPGILADLFWADYDLIDVNLPDPFGAVFSAFASVVRGRPLTVTYHADIIRDGLVYLPFKIFWRPLEWLVLSMAKRIFVTSPDYAKSSPSLRGFMGKVVVAPSFIDPARFNASVDGSKVRAKYGSGKIVLFVGRFVPYKGIDVLLAAAKSVDATFLIVGWGGMQSVYEEKARKMGLKNVVFVGKVDSDSLPSYYGASDVFVLPSVTRQEAFGLVLVEAMACGKPVVSTDFSGMPYVVGDGGLLVTPGDPKALSEALVRILSDKSYAASLSKNGVKRVGELFTRDVVCSHVGDVYKSLVLRDKA
jgi:glycosyltransferase involved in cell wall biosynthesis